MAALARVTEEPGFGRERSECVAYLLVVRTHRRLGGDQHDIETARHLTGVLPCCLAHETAQAIPDYGLPHPFAGYKPEPNGGTAVWPYQHDQPPITVDPAGLPCPAEVGRARYPTRTLHTQAELRDGPTVKRRLPLARLD